MGVFVAPTREPSAAPVAVGSANAATNTNVLVRHTFVDLEEMRASSVRRSNSWPPRGVEHAHLPPPGELPVQEGRERMRRPVPRMERCSSESDLSSVFSSLAPTNGTNPEHAVVLNLGPSTATRD